MPLIVKNKDTGLYIGDEYGGYPKRHEEVKYKKYAKRYKSVGGIKRSVRHVINNDVYWDAVNSGHNPPPGEKQILIVVPDNYEIIEVKK